MKDKTVKQRIERIANEYGTIDKDLLILELEALVTHAKLESLQEPECKHEWKYADIPNGEDGEYCVKCHKKLDYEDIKPSQPECTLDPYCKCEDCKDYNGELPIDRV